MSFISKNCAKITALCFGMGAKLAFSFKDDTEGGIIEATVSHRKSSQQHTQAGPKKYTKNAN